MRKSQKKEKTVNTKIFVRILPSTDFHYDSIKIETNRQVLYVRCLQDLSRGVKIKNPNYWYFCTDGVFWNSCQSEVYEAVTSGLYDELFDGVQAVIISYGQTGTGKTFTTSGLRYPFQKRGLILRILSQLFEEKEARRDVTKICLGMSYLEFNGQLIKDLICNKSLNSVGDVTEYKIPNETWAWTQIFRAEAKKSFSESAPYAGSNRGHSVLSFYIHAESLIDSDPVIRHSKIHIVDMGGIDNVGNKQSEWRHKIDVCNSNLTKTLMEQLILYLAGSSWKRKHQICPYKTNRLLLYLHEAMNGKCLLRFVAHIYGNLESIPITLSTLRFGEKIRLMRPTKLERVLETSRDLEIRNLRKDYIRLKNEVTLNHMFKDSSGDVNISQERLQEIKRAAEAFLFGQLEDLTLFSLGQAHITLKVFKELYHALARENEQIVKEAVAAAAEKIQAQLAADKSAIPSGLPSTQKTSRRRSRQTESQISFGTSNKSADSVQNSAKGHLSVQQAGATDKKGISIGPPRRAPSVFEGNITKAFKKLKSRKSESIVLKGMKSGTTRDFGAHPSKIQFPDDLSRISVIQNVPPRDTLWKIFVNDKVDLFTDLDHKIEVAEENVRNTKRNYLRKLADLAKLREDIDEYKTVLQNCQHIHEVYGKGNREDNTGQVEFEINLIEAISQKESSINEAVENCHVALTDLRYATEELAALKKCLESAFQNFCNEHYKIIYPPEEVTLPEEEGKESGEDIPLELDTKNQAQMELYAQLQEKLLNDNCKKMAEGRRKKLCEQLTISKMSAGQSLPTVLELKEQKDIN